MVAVAAICFQKKHYPFAALFLSLGGTMNSTVMAFGFVMIFCYFVDAFSKKDLKVWQFLKKTFVFAACFVPSLIPFIYYKSKYGFWTPVVAASSQEMLNQDMQWYGKRILSYLFDLNYGIFPYMPILLLTFIILTGSVLVFRRNVSFIKWPVSFLAVISAYSIMNHINHGMSGIARYSAWVLPIMLVGIADSVNFFDKGKIKCIYPIATLSTIITVLVLNLYGVVFANNTSDIQLTPIAKYVISNYPTLYFELEWSFVDRVAHIQGGYYYYEPVIYERDDGKVTKILLTPESVTEVEEQLVLSDEAKQKFEKQIQADDDYFYITFQPKDEVYVK